jgi:Holliday junction DNA helicase RuvA
MIGLIKGNLEYKATEQIVVDVGGVGFEIFVSPMSDLFATQEGEKLTVHTVMIVREDDIKLYGFADRIDVRIFRLLLSVSGIGAKAAMAILSVLDAPSLVGAILSGDVQAISRAQGVGKKSAERVILELGDKDFSFAGEASISSSSISGKNAEIATIESETIDILLSLGYTKNEARKAIDRVGKEAKSVEDLVRLALREM